MNAPVLLFTYSRPDHVDEVIRALSENHIANETDVFAYICKPKDEDIAPMVNATKSVLRKYADDSPFKSFNIVDKDEWVPLGPGMIDAVTEMLKSYERIIVVEDDIVTSKDFLTFMNDALEYYKDDRNVFSVSGYSFGSKSIKELEDTIYCVRRNCPWGWATWRDRWDTYEQLPLGYLDRVYDKEFRKTMRRWAEDLPMLMDALFMERGGADMDWEQQMRYAQCISDSYTVCPKVSKVKNIGFTGMRTNESPVGLNEYFDPEGFPYSLHKVEIDEKFQKGYNKKFIFRFRHKFMLAMSELVYRISPKSYYRLLKKYYKSDMSIEDLKETLHQ